MQGRWQSGGLFWQLCLCSRVLACGQKCCCREAGWQQSKADGLLLGSSELLNPSHWPPHCQLALLCATPFFFKVLGSETFQHLPQSLPASGRLRVAGLFITTEGLLHGRKICLGTEAIPVLSTLLGWFLKLAMEVCTSHFKKNVTWTSVIYK